MIRMIFGIFRLGPIGVVLVAALIAGFGFWVKTVDDRKEAELALALEQGAPQQVNISAFKESWDVGPANEVNVLAQLDFSMRYRLQLDEKTNTGSIKRTHRAWMIPLVPVDAAEGAEALGVFLYYGDFSFIFDFEDYNPLSLLLDADDMGELGPIIAVNGEKSGLGDFHDMVYEVFDDEGRRLVSEPLIINPYVDGRDVALAPHEGKTAGTQMFEYALMIAGALSLLAGFKMFSSGGFTSKKVVQSTVPKWEIPKDPVVETPAGQDAGSAVPLWKRRADEKAVAEQTLGQVLVAPAAQDIKKDVFLKRLNTLKTQ